VDAGQAPGSAYSFLPFQFMRLDGQVLLVNQGGDYLIVSEDDFRSMIDGKLDPDTQAFLDAKAKHFIAEGDSQLPIQLLATKYRTKKSFLRNFTALHMFVVTLRCNQKCKYCHATSANADAARYDMQPETARRAAEVAFSSPTPCIKIEFQGGEPFLNFEGIKEIVQCCEELNQKRQKNLEFVVCTNLTAVSDEQLQFCRDHGVLISTSLDGPRDIHDAYRTLETGSGSYDLFIHGLRRAQAIVGPDRVSALMTTTKASICRLAEVVDEYRRQGLRSIFIRSLNPYGRAVDAKRELGYSTDEFVGSYKEALNSIIDLNARGDFFTESYTSLLLRRMMTPLPTGFVDLQSPTGAAIGCAMYDYDGSVYVSDEGRMLARSGDARFRMGNVLTHRYKELFGGQIARETVGASCVECLPGCSDCAFQMWCGADPVRSYATQGDLVGHRPSSEFCHKNKAIIRFLLEKVEEGDPDTQDVFWSWITQRSFDEVRFFGQPTKP